MGRIVMIIGLLAVFLGWVLYRSLVKRDLMQHKGPLFLGGLFLGSWALLYFWLWA